MEPVRAAQIIANRSIVLKDLLTTAYENKTVPDLSRFAPIDVLGELLSLLLSNDEGQ